MRPSLSLAALFALACTSSLAQAQEAGTAIERSYGSPTAIIAGTASVPPGSRIVFVSGTTPAPLDPANPDELGDTGQQTLSVLTRMRAQLQAQGMDMGDIVKLTVFLVGGPENEGRMDAAAMNEVFRTFFGTAEQPNRPTRSTIQIAALGRPNMRVEIEAIAAKAP